MLIRANSYLIVSFFIGNCYGRDLGIFESYSWPIKNNVIRFLNDVTSKSNLLSKDLTPSCVTSLKSFSNGLQFRKVWAHKMLDSWGKMSPGLFSGKYVDLGHYKQCLSITSSDGSFVGQYSLINIHWSLPRRGKIPHDFKFNFSGTATEGTWVESIADVHVLFYFENFVSAICYPSSCERGDIEKMFKMINQRTFLKPEVKTYTNRFDDIEVGDPYLRSFSTAIIVLLITTTFVSTLSHLLNPEGSLAKTLTNFNAIDTWTKVNAPYFTEAGKRMAFLNGIRAHYLVLAIMAHLFMPISPKILLLYLTENDFYVKNRWWAAMARISGTQVAMSFVMGGALAYYSWHEFMLKSKGKIPFVIYVLVRWLRTLPVILVCLMMIYAHPNTSAGPLFGLQLRNFTDNCYKCGWADITGFSNKMLASEICLPHAWYLSGDYQFYVMSYFLVLLLFRKSMLAIKISTLIMIASMIAHGLVLRGPIIGFPGEIDMRTMGDNVPWILFSNFQHIGSYIVGLLLGYLMVQDYRINTTLLPFVWFFAIQFHTVTQIGPMLAMTLPETLPEPFESVGEPFLTYLRDNPNLMWWFRTVISSTMKQTYSLAFGLICYLLYHEKNLDKEEGGLPMKGIRAACRYLSSNFFAPLGRMSYSLFMVHFLIIVQLMSSVQDVPPITPLEMATRSFYVTVLTYFLGITMYLCVEAPFNNILKSLAKRKK